MKTQIAYQNIGFQFKTRFSSGDEWPSHHLSTNWQPVRLNVE